MSEEKEIEFCPLCSREAIATCDNCEIQFCGLHHDFHDCEEMKQKIAKEKANAWLVGQKYTKQHLNDSALRKVQKEKELEEMREMIEDAINEVNEGEENLESNEQSKKEEE